MFKIELYFLSWLHQGGIFKRASALDVGLDQIKATSRFEQNERYKRTPTKECGFSSLPRGRGILERLLSPRGVESQNLELHGVTSSL